MGRGRAKAKQTKVARQLKYQTLDTDLSALERELRQASSGRQSQDSDAHDSYEDVDDRWSAEDD